jgi:hypothetical protein
MVAVDMHPATASEIVGREHVTRLLKIGSNCGLHAVG